jgi:protein ImuA
VRLRLDSGRVDAALGGGLVLAGCHEIYGAGTGTGATAFALMLALAAPRAGPILWLAGSWEDDGGLYGAGLAELGGDPGRLWLVAAGGAVPMLRAAGEAQHCGALACVVIEAGSAAAVDLTVTRRLQLAAAASGVFTLLLRTGQARPSAALTRWQARAAPARRLAAGAPGPPRLALTLERQRGGPADISLAVEWDRDRCSFTPAEARASPATPIGAAFARRLAIGGAASIGAVVAVAGGRTIGSSRRSAA